MEKKREKETAEEVAELKKSPYRYMISMINMKL